MLGRPIGLHHAATLAKARESRENDPTAEAKGGPWAALLGNKGLTRLTPLAPSLQAAPLVHPLMSECEEAPCLTAHHNTAPYIESIGVLESGHIIGNCIDLLIGHLAGHASHHAGRVVRALADPKVVQL